MDNLILKIRKEEGWTQDEMAEKFKVSREAINKMEFGKMTISPKTILKIQEYEKVKLSSQNKQSKKDYSTGADEELSVVNENLEENFSAGPLGFIAESNRVLAKAVLVAANNDTIRAENEKIYALSQQKLIETNAEILKSYNASIEGAGTNIHPAVESRLDILLEQIAEVASGKKYHSKQEFLAAVGKRFYEQGVSG